MDTVENEAHNDSLSSEHNNDSENTESLQNIPPEDNKSADIANDIKEWYWSDSVKGEGEMPDFLRNEFKTVDQQAKAYNELVKKFGAFHKAPEEYTIDDVKNEKYRIKEGDKNLNGFIEIAKELNMSQDGFNKIIKYFNDNVAPTFKPSGDDINQDEEKTKLGKDWEFKLKRIDNWAKSNAPNKYESIKNMVKTADGVNIMLDLIDKNSNTGNSVPDEPAVSRQESATRESAKALLEEAYKAKGSDRNKKYLKAREMYHQVYK